MTASPNRRYSGHHKATETEGDKKYLEKRSGDHRKIILSVNRAPEHWQMKNCMLTSGSNSGFTLPASSRFQSIDLNSGCC